MKGIYKGGIRICKCWAGAKHPGLDLVGLEDKAIHCPVDGLVRASCRINDQDNPVWKWGNFVRVDDLATGQRYYFCHLALRKVRQGQRVQAGDVIGLEGATGYAGFSHCHVEVRAPGVGRDSLNAAEALGLPNRVGEYPEGEGPAE